MPKKILVNLLTLMLVIGFSSTVEAQKKRKRKKDVAVTPTPPPKPKKNAIQPYNKAVTKEAKTDDGLFKIHTIDDTYLYEIPDSLFEREFLMVTRIAKNTSNNRSFGGQKTNTQVLRWQKKGKTVLLRVVSYNTVADKELPVHEAVVNSNFEPVLFSFPIKAYNNEKTATVIDATELFSTDVKALGLPSPVRKSYKITKLDTKKSFIESIKSYPKNIEVHHVKTYAASAPPTNSSTGIVSVEMSSSMILLPKEPMKRRIFDERVGWFTTSQTDYGSEAQKSDKITFLDRWRLEVKKEDIEKFKRGELVEPKKQIVYYIDRATPKKWRKHIKQGIENWQVAFEAAGFKNAIIAKDPPTKEEDPEWSPEDIRYSVVRYLASPIPNANGPHVSDPRSGEILESDINWYHNVMSLLKGWFFVQTAAINPEAQTTEFKDNVMGELIQFVSSHEVGHTLGLPHNMGSSSAYPVDSLRSATFTKKHGTAPAIMDYARFNYVAQPGDKGVALMPNIGVYDKYAIRWGYRPILDAKTAKDEKETLDNWILEHDGDPLYRFGHQQAGSVVDPSSQTEDLGDDAIKASKYGIANLKRIVPNLINWTAEKGKNYDDLKTMYGHVISQFNRYMGHVSSNIGGVYENYKTYDQEGAVYTYVDKEHQKNCLKFVNTQLFETPTWLIDKNIIERTEYSGITERIRAIQVKTLNNILNLGRMTRMIENETLNGSNAYTLVSMMDDLRNNIWSELRTGKKIDTYRRNLQRAYIEKLANIMKAEDIKKIKSSGSYASYVKRTTVTVKQSDIIPIVRGELNSIKRDAKRAANATTNKLRKYHLQDIVKRIDTILNPR
ncbi:zinc-dependent metalloprotease [Lutibacter profundi]|uniref:Zinc-dependent metalloprotease n=1 Tax=Lutibacter profundi TaxID=1622118 RepID=A0A0X8G880_9FLAO|nr:zinc-dependent metalloprotease [Lutibacter profundi]AMC11840.1 zinc-dependent metalloprotease [Lutibacter profundi]